MAFPKRYEASTTPPPRDLKAERAAAAAEAAAERAAERERKRAERAVGRPEAPPVARSRSDRMMIAMLICAAFFGAYGYGLSVRDQRAAATLPALPQNLNPNAKVKDGVQEVYVDASAGFNPQTVFAKPDIPIKIKFGQGTGCYYGVLFEQFGIYKDLTNGGATVELPALKAGQYQYSCGMKMVYGLVVVR